jgi:hypothetical protein
MTNRYTGDKIKHIIKYTGNKSCKQLSFTKSSLHTIAFGVPAALMRVLSEPFSLLA